MCKLKPVSRKFPHLSLLLVYESHLSQIIAGAFYAITCVRAEHSCRISGAVYLKMCHRLCAGLCTFFILA